MRSLKGARPGTGKRPPAGVRLSVRRFPSLDDACRALRDLSRGGKAAAIDDLSALSPAEAERLLELFLHDAAIDRPIQPFAALLDAVLRRRTLGLWDLDPGAAEAEKDFLRDLPRDHPECLSCACFPQCQGYGAWAGACETWRAVVAGIAAAAREVAGLRRGAGKPDRSV